MEPAEPIAQRTRSRTSQPVAPPRVGPIPPPRVGPTPSAEPIARRTRSHTQQAQLVTPIKAASRQYPAAFLSRLALPVLTESGRELNYRQLIRDPHYADVWSTSYANELGRLCQGIGKGAQGPSNQRVEGTDTFRPIRYEDIPKDRRKDICHTMVVCEVRPQKADPNRTRITLAGGHIQYPGDVGTPTGSLDLVKLMINSVLSRRNARFACFDAKNFYLQTPMARSEYVRIKLSDIPQEVIDEYNLLPRVHNGWVYYEVVRGCYGLPQAGKLANDLLRKRLDKAGYYEAATTPGLWRHKWRPVQFVLIVDDFGVEYVGEQHAQHLLTVLRKDYEMTTDWTGSKFAGVDLEWNYAANHSERTCRLSMDGYIERVLRKHGHPQPKRPQHAPHKHREIIYGAAEQLTPEEDSSPELDEAGKKRIQEIVGALLYYGRAVDNKILVALSAIGAQQASPTERANAAIDQLLDYCATYPDDGILYRSSDMLIAAHADAGFHNESKGRSRAGAHIFLSEDAPMPKWNGAVLTIAQIIKFVMTSASEAELGALFITAQALVPIRNTLEEMGWPQKRTPIQTDNSAAAGVVNNTIVPRKLKAMDRRLHWLRCRDSQGQFRYYWAPGSMNWGDYSTKHHPPIYHTSHRLQFAGYTICIQDVASIEQ